MERDFVISGVHIGEHSFVPEKIKDELKQRCIDQGHNFVTIRPSDSYVPDGVSQHYYIEWAKYLAENKVYFVFLYAVQHPPKGKKSHIDKETIDEMKKCAGKYFLGEMLGETGSQFACVWKKYYEDRPTYIDMEDAHKKYLDTVKGYIETCRELGFPNIVSVEATALQKYDIEAGVEIPMLECMCGQPEILISTLRGTARAFDLKMWGTYIAHEWYGGVRHEDILKRKRMSLAYKYAYLSGSNAFCLESGDEAIGSYGYDIKEDDILCKEYRDELKKMTEYIKEDCRPVGGPKAKFAFVQGNHDSWGSWGGSSLWNQFDRPEWGHSEAEYSWRILDEVNAKRNWYDIANYGDEDLSATPAYGMYDVIPSEAPVEAMKKYDYIVFMGWNSMTDEIYEKLLEYVNAGGKLLMTAAHLNYSSRRDGEKKYIDNEKLEKLFGCKFTGETVLTNNGIKFARESLTDNLYPGTRNKELDPIYSAGYALYLKTEVTSGYVMGEMQQDFWNTPEGLPMVIENKVGKGVATLVTTESYPGNPAVMPLYRALVREMMTKSARDCEIKVKSNGALRYSVYEGNKMYLLNTDYDMDIDALISFNGKETKVTVKPLELKAIQL